MSNDTNTKQYDLDELLGTNNESSTIVAESPTEEALDTPETVAEETTTEMVTTEAETAEEVEAQVEVEVDPPDTGSVYALLEEHGSKISNASKANMQFPNVRPGRYVLFITNDGDEKTLKGDIYLHENLDQLYIENFTPSNITVHKSGIIVESNTKRAYIGKTNTISFNVLDGSPTIKTVVRKGQDSPIETISVDSSDMDIDAIKLHISKSSPRLSGLVAEMTEKSDIKNETLAFMAITTDINHLIKLNEDVMMTCKL
jgi:hypothetical protein